MPKISLLDRDHSILAFNARVFDWAWQRRTPLAMTMAGGYGRDIAITVGLQVNSYRVALDYGRRWQALSAARA